MTDLPVARQVRQEESDPDRDPQPLGHQARANWHRGRHGDALGPGALRPRCLDRAALAGAPDANHATMPGQTV